MNLSKYLWYTDTHLDKVSLLTLYRFIRNILKTRPAGVFLTGDISSGPMLSWHLRLMAYFIKCPIYFVLGNHDYYFTYIEKQHEKLRKLCQRHPNLIWLTDTGVVDLGHQVALIGAEGWYDARLGNPKYLTLTPDWLLIKDFKNLKSMEDRIQAFRQLSQTSCQLISNKLELALSQKFKKIYILTHFPPWKEATRDEGTFLEPFFLPYNVNLALGQTIEKIMEHRKKRNVMVLSGHTHTDCWIHVSRNIECKVNKAKYYGHIRNEEHIFI